MFSSTIFVIFVIFSLIFSIIDSKGADISSALFSGAADSVSLCIGMCGSICLWCALMEIMKECGLCDKLSRLTRPILRKIFPSASDKALGFISLNVSANMLGLGNAATPFGISACKEMRVDDRATNDICTLMVINSSSIQLIPTTLMALMLSHNSQNAFSILPCVWITSVSALLAGVLCCKVLERFT